MTGEVTPQLIASHFSIGAEVYQRHWAPILRELTVPLLDRLALGGARVVLDVGTGTGGLAEALTGAAPGATIVGVDRAEGMLRRATPSMRRAVMDARRVWLFPKLRCDDGDMY